MSAPVYAPAAGRFPAFRSPDFRRLFLNTFFTSAARWALMLARGWLVFELTDSSLAVGIVTFAAMVQFVIVGPLAGALADRVDRRRLSLAFVSMLLLSSTTLAALTIAGVVEVWHVVLLAVVDGAAVAGSQPALQALIPSVVREEDLLNAVSLSGITRHGSRLVGPLFGGVLLETAGAGSVFLLSAVALVFALFQLWRIEYRSPPIATAPGSAPSPGRLMRSLLGDVRRGVEHARGDRRLVVILIFIAFHCGFTMAFDSMLPRLSTTVGGGSRTFSALLMGVGAGAITGTLAISMVRGRVAQGRWLAVTGVVSGLAMVVMGMATTPLAAVAGAMLAGGSQATYMAISLTLILEIVPDAMRGRITSLYMLLAAGHMAFMNFGFGWLADIVGVRPLMVIPGVAWIVLFGIGALVTGELRHVVRRGAFREPALAPELAAPGVAGGS